jgi:hypothetical protein
MTEEDIHLLAKETAGQHWFYHAHLMRFAKAAIAQARRDERERCAKVCEQTSWGAHRGDYLRGHEDARLGVAAAIRAMEDKSTG